jgi:hypothetical protein
MQDRWLPVSQLPHHPPLFLVTSLQLSSRKELEKAPVPPADLQLRLCPAPELTHPRMAI